MKIETFDSVWDAVSDTPEQAEICGSVPNL